MPGTLHGVFPVPVICTEAFILIIMTIMQDTIPVSISLPATMASPCMIFIPTMKNTTKQTAGITPTVPTITAAGTVEKRAIPPTEVLSLRFRMIRNACAVLMSSRGTRCSLQVMNSETQNTEITIPTVRITKPHGSTGSFWRKITIFLNFSIYDPVP